MKLLLGIFSCHRYDYHFDDQCMKDWYIRTDVDRVSALRDTWLRDVDCDYKIFYGRGANRESLADEIFLDAPDDYQHSSQKLKKLVQYALDTGHDRLLKIDDDTWAYWDRLKKIVPSDDYVGGGPSNFAAGFTYWLSAKAMNLLVNTSCYQWQEDFWVGRVLESHGVKFVKDPRYFVAPTTKENQYILDEELAKSNNYLTIHALSPDQMRKVYKEKQNGEHPGDSE